MRGIIRQKVELNPLKNNVHITPKFKRISMNMLKITVKQKNWEKMR